MPLEELLSRFALALGIGLLIGLERGWRARADAPGHRAAGIRTFAASGLLGGVIGAIVRSGPPDGGLVLGLAFAAFAVMFSLFCREQNRAEGVFSATTAVAGMLTFALGAYAVLGDMRVAAALGVVTAGLLAAREDLHGWVARITWPELRAGFVLLAMTFVALPLVPNRDIALLGGINPQQVWLIAIVLAGVSFVGYVAVRSIGPERGTLVAATAGGLVSSTAVTVAQARRAAQGEGDARLLAAGALLANAISFLRVAAIVAVLNLALLSILGPALAAGAAVSAAAALFNAWRVRQDPGAAGMSLRNPFSLLAVLGYAVLLGAIMVIGRTLSEQAGTAGAVAGAIAMGLADLDAITVALARLAPAPLSAPAAALAIMAAIASNTAAKVVLAAAIGRGRFALEVTAASILALVAAGAAFWLMLVLPHG